MEPIVGVEDPRADDVQLLLSAHLAFAHEHTPSGHVHALDVERLLDPAVTFFGARCSGELRGVGALRRLDATHVELKSMHVGQGARGQGIGRLILDHLLRTVIEQGYQRVSLETGSMEVFAPARALYASAGFEPCEPFADYSVNPYSVCMTRTLVGP